MSKIDWSKVVTKEQRDAEATAAKFNAFITERNNRLDTTDWVVTRSLETNEPIPEACLTYRQALRDLPETTTDYDNVEWPIKPE